LRRLRWLRRLRLWLWRPLRPSRRAIGSARPQRIGDLVQLSDRHTQADQDEARRNRDGSCDDQRTAEIEFADRNPKTDRDNACRNEQNTRYKQDHRHTGSPLRPAFLAAARGCYGYQRILPAFFCNRND
jgi:hypothetical protein